MKIAIIGGGAGGLLAALLLARAGHEVTVLEQDRMEPAGDVESAAGAAYRPLAPQIVQPHAVMARCRELVRDRLPDVYDGLPAAGVAEVPISDWMPDTLADRSGWPGDERLSPLMTRGRPWIGCCSGRCWLNRASRCGMASRSPAWLAGVADRPA